VRSALMALGRVRPFGTYGVEAHQFAPSSIEKASTRPWVRCNQPTAEVVQTLWPPCLQNILSPSFLAKVRFYPLSRVSTE
jgi:hypothetical protein